MAQPWLLINLVIIGLIALLTTVVFCFWCVYLLDTMRNKWKIYGKAFKTLDHRSDFQEQSVVYNAKTEFVKSVFLFSMNLVEWFAFVSCCASYLTKVYSGDLLCQNQNFSNQSGYQNEGLNIPCFFKSTEVNYNSKLMNSILFLGDNLIVLSLILIACLCEYLVERYSRKSWLKSNNIPILIVIFLVYTTVIQFISLFCVTVIIARWFNTIVLTVSLVIAVRQYKRLKMVIQWTITDLEICQLNKKMLRRAIRQKNAFNTVFRFIWLGTAVMIAEEYFRNFVLTVNIPLNELKSFNFDISICEGLRPTYPIISDIFGISIEVDNLMGITGFCIFFIPYIVVGIANMCLFVWIHGTGSSGHITRYHNHNVRYN